MSAAKSLPPTPLFYRLAELAAMLSVSEDTILRWTAEGTFPAPVKAGRNTRLYDVAEVEAWRQKRLAERTKPEPPPEKRGRGRPRADGTPAQPRKQPTPSTKWTP
jgi:excisionase family DNA binding protein